MSRRQLPVFSPIRVRMLIAGVHAQLSEDRGPSVERALSTALSARMRGAHVELMDSGTSALAEAMLRTAGNVSRPVAVPAYGCFDLATAVDSAGVPFVLYDVDERTLGPDFNSLRDALQGGANRVVVVHQYGMPVDMPRVRQIAHECSAIVIEDAAQGVGGANGEATLGSIGDYGILSFGRGKGLSGGGGGALVIRRGPDGRAPNNMSAVRPRAAWVPLAVKAAAQWLLGRPSLFAFPASLPFLAIGETSYRLPSDRRSMARFSMGMLAEALAEESAESHARHANALRLLAALAKAGWPTLEVVPGGSPGFLRLPAILPAGSRRESLLATGGRLGIMPGYPKSLADLEGFASRRLNPEDEVGAARRLAEALVTLPTHSALTEADLQKLERWIASVA